MALKRSMVSQQRLGRVLLDQHGRGAEAQREAQQAAQAEGEGERRRAAERRRPCACCRIERGKQSHIAITSRWKCIVPFGLPVVPEVKAISATSSAAVGTLLNAERLLQRQRCRASRARRRTSSGSASGKDRFGSAASSSASRRLSHSACVISALVMISVSSFARSSGMVADAHAARLHHREPARGHHRVVRPAQQHAVARLQAHLAHQHVGEAVRLREELRVGALAVGRAQRDAMAVAARHRLVEQLGGAVQARRDTCSSGRSKSNSGHCSRGGRLSRAKRVDVCAV